ncbi:MAG: GNAT family N-acetyltransferase [Desulfovibrio sp.]|nr:GNAT family N-acetyltransferase [Desulfovibrio sp.]
MALITLATPPGLNEPAHLVSLRKQWTHLAVESDQADPFCCGPAWQLAALRVLNPAQTIFLQQSDTALLTLAEHRSTSGPSCCCPLEGSWLFGCPLLGRDIPELLELFEAALIEILRHSRQNTRHQGWPYMVISGLRPGTTLPRVLWRRFNGPFIFYRHSSSTQCAASLRGGLDGFLSRRSANHRAKLRKAARQAREQGVSFERYCPGTAEEALILYERMLSVEHTSWKGLGQCGMAESPAREFYAAMISDLARNGEARIILARHEEKDIGFIFGGMAGKIYRGQQFSYSADWKKSSIGNLLQAEKISWLCEEGAERYDMGPVTGPRMGYKEHWTEEQREIETWLLQKR